MIKEINSIDKQREEAYNDLVIMITRCKISLMCRSVSISARRCEETRNTRQRKRKMSRYPTKDKT